jgi:SAM-dependent methyltransferase
MTSPAEFWRGNTNLRDITPRGERFPEVGLFEALRKACTGSVFEFGCGDGRLSRAFDPGSYVGYDINPSALAAAKKANPHHSYASEWFKADTFLAHTVLLHVPDDELVEVIERAKGYQRIVIGEVMGRKWRRPGDPPVFNREAHEYTEMVGREPEVILVPYPRYSCDLHMLVF